LSIARFLIRASFDTWSIRRIDKNNSNSLLFSTFYFLKDTSETKERIVILSHGELLRELRIKKGVTQKDLYDSVMSKSYAIRFEQGKHEISFHLIQLLLERLGMEIDEFLYIYHGFQESLVERFYDEYGLKGNANDIDGLIALRSTYRAFPTSYQNSLRLTELDARIEQLTYFNQHGVFLKEAISKETRQTIHDYLDRIETWTIGELRFFANTLDFIDYERKTEYFRSILPSLHRYKQFKRGRTVICTLLINEIHELIMTTELGMAQILLVQLDDFSQGIEAMFYRNTHHFYSGLLLIAQGNVTAGTLQVEQAIMIYETLGYPHQAALSRSFYQLLRPTNPPE